MCYDYDADTRARRVVEPPKRAAARAGAARGVRARPRPGAALLRVPPAGRQDPGGRARRGRLPAHPADPLARGRPDRPRDRCRARLRSRHRRHRRAGARHRPPAVRAQRRGRAGCRSPASAAGSRATRRRCACSPASRRRSLQPGGAARRPQPHPRHAGRHLQVPVAAPAPARASSATTPPTREAFDWLRAGAPAGRRCLEAQVMDWADDVAYSVHDVEDGVHGALVALGAITDDERAQLCRIAAEQYSTWTAGELAPVLDALLDLPTLRDLASYDGTAAAQAAAKRATSELVGRLSRGGDRGDAGEVRRRPARALRGRPRRPGRRGRRVRAVEGGRRALRDGTARVGASGRCSSGRC